ncbi:MAG: hypothetical protein V2A73_16580 [Pseudomonadota bacterium]
MRALRWLVPVALAGATALAAAATVAKVGAERVDHPIGLSLREESARNPQHRGFFLIYGNMFGRSHWGGGLAGGK